MLGSRTKRGSAAANSARMAVLRALRRCGRLSVTQPAAPCSDITISLASSNKVDMLCARVAHLGGPWSTACPDLGAVLGRKSRPAQFRTRYDRLISAYSWFRFVGALHRIWGRDGGFVSMRGMSVLGAAGLILLAIQPARAQAVPVAAEAGAVYRPAGQAGEASAAGAANPSGGWSAQDIQLAQARCAVLLKGLEVVAVPEGPLREGSECGAPAPMRLISVGKSPQVAFSPPPILTCDMIAQLHTWVQRDVQPLARKFMAAPIVRIETMSSYSCRNAYGRAHGRLSEHGRANAVDIGAFVTALGQAALVISDWGPTAREVAAAAATASKAAAQQASAAARAGKGGPEPAAQPQAVVSVAPAAEPPGRAAAAITGFS